MQEGLLEGAFAGASGTMSESGWSNTEIFSQYMQEHLIKYLLNAVKTPMFLYFMMAIRAMFHFL